MIYSLFDESNVIGIIGCRKRDSKEDFLAVERAFLLIYKPGDTIVSGGCPKGGDRFAEGIAVLYGVPITTHKPDDTALDQRLLERNPRAAWAKVNYERNGLIAKEATVLIACQDPNRKKDGGTEDTIAKFKRLHKNGEVISV